MDEEIIDLGEGYKRPLADVLRNLGTENQCLAECEWAASEIVRLRASIENVKDCAHEQIALAGTSRHDYDAGLRNAANSVLAAIDRRAT